MCNYRANGNNGQLNDGYPGQNADQQFKIPMVVHLKIGFPIMSKFCHYCNGITFEFPIICKILDPFQNLLVRKLNT